MSRPFAEVIAELPPMTSAERRSHKTVNRDLSRMATVARHLATTSWKPRMPGATVMDFGAGRIAIESDPDVDMRPPWTTAHLEYLFRCLGRDDQRPLQGRADPPTRDVAQLRGR